MTTRRDPSSPDSNVAPRDDRGRRAFLRRLGATVAASVAVTGAAPPAAVAQSSKRPKKKRAAAPGARKPKPAAPAPVKSVARKPAAPPARVAQGAWPSPEPGARIDLAPARWIWLPCERTLANTFVLFRREVEVEGEVASARGWISADSRYRLFVNGRRVQWGPAPCDPRAYEADPIDLTRWLVPGPNVIGVEVLFYGHGEGTWPLGKPGFLFALRVEEGGGRVREVMSDGSWRASSTARTGRGSSSGGTCGRCRRTSTRGCGPRAGASPAEPRTRRGRRRRCWRSRPTARPPPGATTTTSPTAASTPPPRSCGPARCRSSARRSGPSAA